MFIQSLEKGYGVLLESRLKSNSLPYDMLIIKVLLQYVKRK